MLNDSPIVKEFAAHMVMSPKSVTVDDSGNADVLYERTITDKDTGEVVVKDVVRVSDKLAIIQPVIDELNRKAAAK